MTNKDMRKIGYHNKFLERLRSNIEQLKDEATQVNKAGHYGASKVGDLFSADNAAEALKCFLDQQRCGVVSDDKDGEGRSIRKISIYK